MIEKILCDADNIAKAQYKITVKDDRYILLCEHHKNKYLTDIIMSMGNVKAEKLYTEENDV